MQRCNIAVLACLAGVLGWSPEADAAAPSCRGPAELDNYLAVSGKVSLRRTDCRAARSVVTRFADRCVGAYTSQGSCRIKTRKRWRCSSRLRGSVNSGAPSSIGCTAKRSSLRFKLRLSEDAIAQTGSPYMLAHPGPPFLPADNCIAGDAAGPVVTPPPDPPHETIELHAFGSVPLVVAEGVQADLVAHSVVPRLVNGLGVRPPSYPTRVPVFLRKGVQQGITGQLCSVLGSGRLDNASVVAIGDSVTQAASVATHELFHAHAWGIKASPVMPWFDDAAADWSRWRAGMPFEPVWDVMLQQPNIAADTLNPDGYRYGMWRFVQFLDDKGLVVSGNSWPLIRAVIAGAPAESAALDQFLRGRQTSLGQELAAFWGEHLKANTRRPPQLVPVAANSQTVQIAPGRRDYELRAAALHTGLVDFRLADGIKRVEFEFSPPTNGYFWGLVAADESTRFQTDDTVAFCAGESGGTERDWPGAFPVTFTNGFLSGTTITGRVRVFAQTQSDQCKDTTGKACTVLSEAGARGLLGPDLPNIGGFSGSRGVSHGRRYTSCAYRGQNGLGLLRIDGWSSSKALRRWIAAKGKAPGWRPIAFGDAAVILTRGGGHCFIQVALGRQLLSVSVHGPGAQQKAFDLASDAIPKVR